MLYTDSEDRKRKVSSILVVCIPRVRIIVLYLGFLSRLRDVVISFTPRARLSIANRPDIFIRFGKEEKQALACFDFLDKFQFVESKPAAVGDDYNDDDDTEDMYLFNIKIDDDELFNLQLTPSSRTSPVSALGNENVNKTASSCDKSPTIIAIYTDSLHQQGISNNKKETQLISNFINNDLDTLKIYYGEKSIEPPPIEVEEEETVEKGKKFDLSLGEIEKSDNDNEDQNVGNSKLIKNLFEQPKLFTNGFQQDVGKSSSRLCVFSNQSMQHNAKEVIKNEHSVFSDNNIDSLNSLNISATTTESQQQNVQQQQQIIIASKSSNNNNSNWGKQSKKKLRQKTKSKQSSKQPQVNNNNNNNNNNKCR